MTHVVDEDLTSYDVKVYAAVLQAWNDFGISPSYIELQQGCFCSSPTIRKAIQKLKKKGYVTAPKYQVRAIRPTDPERTISNKPLAPWASLAPPRRFFKEKQPR